MAEITKTETIWFNGAFVPWHEAKVHVLAHTLHYGTGVFEGIRSYLTDRGPAVFRLDAHLERFFRSAATYEIPIPYTREQLTDATLELVRRNRLETAYIRPIAIFDVHTLTLLPADAPVTVAIAGWPMGAYLPAESDRGVRVTVSPVRRFNPSAIPPAAKSCGQYVNSVRATQDAARRGFHEAILLTDTGDVSEGAGENLFVVKNGVVVTNDANAAILMGITRDSILQIARDLGIPTEIRTIRPEELPGADELFFCGTAVEVTPIEELDGTVIGDGRPGPITRQIRNRFLEIARGRHAAYFKWLAFARAGAPHQKVGSAV
ncbi:MAG: branched-chain amino acid transaminase [Acidobacteria bacterium]|nr:branched-chain amino acid transaminase [Acidobacteriota bacterium]